MNKRSILYSIFAMIGLAGLLKISQLYSAVTPVPLAYWQHIEAKSNEAVDHQAWGKLLQQYVIEDRNNRVRQFNYQAVSSADKRILKSYLADMQAVDPRRLNRNEQLAYWVNLYNALTVNLVLQHFPISSIKEIGDGITGPWNIPIARVAEQTLSLNQIEHKILRPIFKDKRIHYVINCASIGCPDLPDKPLTGKTVEQQLEQGAHRFINQSKGVYVDGDTLVLSSIYKWFLDDFGASHAHLLLHLSHYAEPELKQGLAEFSGDIKFDYNWKLNGTDLGLVMLLSGEQR